MSISRCIPHLSLVIVAAAAVVGCQSFEPIQTNPPTAAVEASEGPTSRGSGPAVDVQFYAGENRLPPSMSELRFRIPRITLVTGEGTPNVRELPHGRITVSSGEAATSSLLRANFPPGDYEEIRLSLNNVYVEYGPNAGGPLTVENGDIRVPMPDGVPSDGPLILRLTFHPDDSFGTNADGSWRFSPRFSAEVLEATQVSRTR